MIIEFDRSKHVFHSETFSEIIKDTIRFFNGTPVHRLPPPENFDGAGVYALYYIGKNTFYERLYEQNRTSFAQPIYVGKAVPRGWRQARTQTVSNELFARLNDHLRSISAVGNLKVEDFRCRFMILEDAATDMIGTVEASLIRHYKPLWNTTIDGFGNHTPGAGRFNQSKSDWDVLHPGRAWADKCTGKSSTPKEVMEKIKRRFEEDEQH